MVLSTAPTTVRSRPSTRLIASRTPAARRVPAPPGRSALWNRVAASLWRFQNAANPARSTSAPPSASRPHSRLVRLTVVSEGITGTAASRPAAVRTTSVRPGKPRICSPRWVATDTLIPSRTRISGGVEPPRASGAATRSSTCSISINSSGTADPEAQAASRAQRGWRTPPRPSSPGPSPNSTLKSSRSNVLTPMITAVCAAATFSAGEPTHA